MLDLERIGSRITELRKQAGLTQYDLADKLFVTHQAVSKWENGKSIPGIEVLYDITKLFDVPLDYLLADTDIDDRDYPAQLRNYPREVVVNRFLQSPAMKDDVDQIFYLLNKKERLRIINHVIFQQHSLEVDDLWHYLNKAERTYLLGAILSGKCDFDLGRIYTQLSRDEQRLAHHAYQEGSYAYRLPYVLHK